MENKRYAKAILLGVGISLLAMSSCSDDVMKPEDRPDNGSIALQVGVSNEPARQPMTRADGSDTYVPLATDTKIRLRVNGTWTGKSPELISKTTSATAGNPGGNTYNPMTFNPVLYWDDYGTGDPANATTGRRKGLDILAVAVDGQTTDVPAIAGNLWETPATWDNTQLPWKLKVDGTDVLTRDILVANNLSNEKTPLKFDEQNSNNRLIFQHLMSKITFKLTPAEGFMLSTPREGYDYAFEKTPEVKLTRDKYENGVDPKKTHYAIVDGTIDIRAAKATGSEKDFVLAGVIGSEKKNDTKVYKVEELAALVYPGTCLGETDETVVARINADDNVYYVYAKEIREAITKALGAGNEQAFNTLPGYNYVINVTVRKTGINVTATVANWVDVEAADAFPEIRLTEGAGTAGSDPGAIGEVFDFFRSASISTDENSILYGYSVEAGLREGDYFKPLRLVKPEGSASPRACSFYDATDAATLKPLYWPDHQTHYHFRGIYPRTTTEASTTDAPQVKAMKEGKEQGIPVRNGIYDQNTFPSNLMIGAPEFAEETLCGDGKQEHAPVEMSKWGICARSGNINLNFRYMLSQVEIELADPLEELPDGKKVVLDDQTKVEIIGGYTKGYIRLGDRTAVGTTQDAYKLDNVAFASETDEKKREVKKRTRHSIILPQALQPAGGQPLQFKITVNNADGTLDYYYATIRDIPVGIKGSTSKEKIEKWEPGKHYKYTLRLSKTEMRLTATLTDWITVEAEDDIWM